MPVDIVVSAASDADLAKLLTDSGAIKATETGFVSSDPEVLVSYIGKAKNPDTEPVLDAQGRDTRPDLPGVLCLVGLSDARRAAIEAKLKPAQVVTSKPIRVFNDAQEFARTGVAPSLKK